jgi:hypothetical protein
MILTCSLRFLTLPLIKFSFSFSVFCGNRTGIVFMIFLSLYVFFEVSHVEGSSLTTSLRYQDLLSFL